MKRSVLMILFLSLAVITAAASRDTVYYFAGNYAPTRDLSNARFMSKVIRKSSRVQIVKPFVLDDHAWKPEPRKKIRTLQGGEQLIHINNKLFDPETIHRYSTQVDPGLFSFSEYEKGKLVREGKATCLVPLMPEDTLKEYYRSGQIKTVAFYRNNRLTGNRNWLHDGSAYIDNIYYSADSVPEYSMGNGYFSQYIRNGLSNSGIDYSQYNDQVILGWVILETGEIAGVHIVYGSYRELNQFLVNLVASLPGSWLPATINGEKVRYYMTIPLNFNMQKKNFDLLQLNGIGQLDWN